MRADYLLLVSCPDRPGIVARISSVLFEHGANIEESQQFDDARTDTFFLRIRFSMPVEDADLEAWRARFAATAEEFSMDWQLWDASTPHRTVLMVSKFDHVLHDLLYRWRRGQLNMEVVAVISNHPDLRPLVESYGLPYHHIPVTADTKPAAEAALREVLADVRADLIVLARYMQVLSDELTRELSGKVINIHHSFLPSFKGAKPYHQAFARGVKLIGATAHYVTSDLDEGPIIEQDVARVDHRFSAEELVAAGEEVESRVLVRAVRWHCESRVMLHDDRTVVFN